VCIGSKSWPFELLATCIAEVRTLFPWRVATHVLPPDNDPPIWQQVFADQHIQRVEQIYPVPDQTRIVLTQRLLPRMRVDTAPRPWEPQGNNTLLLDSLNGYSVTESARPETFTLHIAPTFEQYLTRAVENYAVWLEFFGEIGRAHV